MVDFLGIGAQKSGTTWLYHQLAQHPQIAFPGGKEVHFWDRADPALAGEWLKLMTPQPDRTADGRPRRSGEITPAYAILPVEAIRALKRCCPDVRLFIILRNPMSRAWSAAVMGLIRAQLFEREVSDQWFLDHFNSAASRARGDYAGCLERWWSVFPREQLLVLLHDDIAAAPRRLLEGLAKHIDIDPTSFSNRSDTDLSEFVVPVITGEAVYAGQQNLSPRPSLVPALCELYAPGIEQLSRLLGRDMTFWLERFAACQDGTPRKRHELEVGGLVEPRIQQLMKELGKSERQ